MKTFGGIFDIAARKKQADELSMKMAESGFWENEAESTRVVRQLKALKSCVESWEAASGRAHELRELAAILRDEQDKDLVVELQTNTDTLSAGVEALALKTYLSGRFDACNCILSINAGAGGTESCDWVSMLLRMYSRWAQNRGYNVKTIDILPGEEAGVKNVTIVIEGEYAYGYLKAERGVHRLVRISPFDANKRRHTSFASVDVIPEVAEEIDIKLEEKDVRIDVYRSKGAGGQSVNTTDSAVRITHIPTGIVAQCQNERSQYQNKQMALLILKARLYEHEQEKQEQELQKQYGHQKKKIEWGSQIRSYVVQPYTLVKDHRTDLETGDINKVLDGGIDGFIEAHLKQRKIQT